MPRRFLNGIAIAEVATLPAASSNTGALLRQGGKLWCSNGTSWVDLEATGGSGATISRHEIDFGSTPREAITVDLAVAGVSSGQRVVAALSLDMPAGVAADEIEMDPITLAAHAVAADTVRVLAVAGAPVSGRRAINIMR